MKRRLYYVLPSVASAQNVVNELLLKRIPIHHMHAVGAGDIDMKDLPVASAMQRNDFLRAIWIGACVGALLGLIAGMIGHAWLSVPLGGMLTVTAGFGAFISAWAAGMIGISAPNAELAKFSKTIEQGHILLMVDVPKERVDDIEHTLHAHHPEANFKGLEPSIPKFP